MSYKRLAHQTKAALETYRKETGAKDTYAGSMFRENT